MSTNNALNVNPSTPLAPDDGGTGVSNGSNTLTVSANSSIDQNVTTIGNPTFQGVISGATAGIANNYFQSLSPTSGQGYMLVRSPDNSGARINTLTNIATTGDRTWSFPDASGTVALIGSPSLTYNSVSGTTQAAIAANAYILNNASATTVTLPTSASSTIGDTIKIKGRSSAAWIIQANTSQVIKLGSVSSSAAGTATSASGSDSIQLVYVAADEWSVDWALSSAIVLA